MQSSRSVLDSIRRIVQALRVGSRAAERELGVSGAQLFVLQTLSKSERALSVNELAERTRTHQSSVSTVISRLCEQGWVSRKSSAEDARRMEIALTASGTRILRKSPPTPQENIIQAVEKLTAKEQEQLAALLVRVVEGAGLEREPAEMFFE